LRLSAIKSLLERKVVSPAVARGTVSAAVQPHHRFDGLQFARAAGEALVGGEFGGLIAYGSVSR